MTTTPLQKTWKDEPRRLAVGGDWTVENGKQSCEEIKAFIASEPAGRLLLDLSGLRFIDSHGISNLLMLKAALAASGRTLVIVDPSAVSRKVFQLISLGRLIPIEDLNPRGGAGDPPQPPA